MISEDLLKILACPVCKTSLVLTGPEKLKCSSCNRAYPIRNDIPILLEEEATREEP
jgi:uncharacterized protein YbaR (Trm112 family)